MPYGQSWKEDFPVDFACWPVILRYRFEEYGIWEQWIFRAVYTTTVIVQDDVMSSQL